MLSSRAKKKKKGLKKTYKKIVTELVQKSWKIGLPSWYSGWLRIPNSASLGLIPGQGIRSHLLQLGVCMTQLKKRSHIPQVRPGAAK